MKPYNPDDRFLGWVIAWALALGLIALLMFVVRACGTI
jgi:hypothetical protein